MTERGVWMRKVNWLDDSASLCDAAAFARVVRQMKTGGAERRAVECFSEAMGRPGAPRSAILGTPVLLSGTKGPTGIEAITPPIPRGKVAPPFTGLGFLRP